VTQETKVIKIAVKIFHIQKDGNSEDEYEDAYARSEDNLNFALADGAADSIFSGIWAKMLVEDFVYDPFTVSTSKDNFLDWFEPLQRRWQSEVGSKNLPWYMENKARIGAFATLLGLSITSRQTRRIVCLSTSARETTSIVCAAVGDTCVFILHDNFLTPFPVSKVTDFNNTPYLLGTYPRYNARIKEHIQTLNLDISDGDLIIMATDALSKWFLAEFQQGQKPWLRFENITGSEYTELIRSLRDAEEMRNDDTTVMFISPE
jgi:serine/threonine protein phosphatase PrpC